MKKYFILMIVTLLFTFGCESVSKTSQGVKKEDDKVTCKFTSNNTKDGYKISSEYNIYKSGSIVKKVVSKEEIESDDESVLDYFLETLNSTYESVNETYGGYDINIEKKDGKVYSQVIIDYTKMDVKAYVSDNTAMKGYVNSNNEMLASGLISIYESMGAVCK